jgi:hypothetical protein
MSVNGVFVVSLPVPGGPDVALRPHAANAVTHKIAPTIWIPFTMLFPLSGDHALFRMGRSGQASVNATGMCNGAAGAARCFRGYSFRRHVPGCYTGRTDATAPPDTDPYNRTNAKPIITP